MGNNRRHTRPQYRSPEGRRGPSYYTAKALHSFLVDDAVKGHATEIRWAVGAYEEIAKQRKQTIDDATKHVMDEVAAMGRSMPMI